MRDETHERRGSFHGNLLGKARDDGGRTAGVGVVEGDAQGRGRADRDIRESGGSGTRDAPNAHQGAQVSEPVFVRFTVAAVFPHGPAAAGSR